MSGAKWPGYNGAEMLNGGRDVQGSRAEDGAINIHSVYWSLHLPRFPQMVLFICRLFVFNCLAAVFFFGLTLMRLSRGRLLCICSNQ